jgi:hypothetical protein
MVSLVAGAARRRAPVTDLPRGSIVRYRVTLLVRISAGHRYRVSGAAGARRLRCAREQGVELFPQPTFDCLPHRGEQKRKMDGDMKLSIAETNNPRRALCKAGRGIEAHELAIPMPSHLKALFDAQGKLLGHVSGGAFRERMFASNINGGHCSDSHNATPAGRPTN